MLGRGKHWPVEDASDVSIEEGGVLLRLPLFRPTRSKAKQTSRCEDRVLFSQPHLPACAIHGASVHSTLSFFRVN